MLRNVGFLTPVILVLAACSPENAAPGAESPAAEWVAVFDGRDLSGFTPTGDANWRIEDGAVVADAGTGFLVSAESYADFDLTAEFYASPDANSGVFIRCDSRTEIGAAACYEVNIFDRRPDPAYRTGAIVDVATPRVQIDTGNRWNTYEIAAHGKHLLIKLNGETTVDVEDDKHAAGPFALQYGAGLVKFRNVRVKRGR